MTADASSRRPLKALVVLLGTAMVTATYLQGALAVLSSFVIAEFAISRSALGVAFAVFSLTGAATSPLIGSLADRGARRVMIGLFVLGIVGILMAAGAPTFGVLLAALVVGGFGLGAGNPVTNRVISEQIPPRRRGLVVGFKQAGPPVGLLAAGLVLPLLAVAWGWRVALGLSALLPVVGLLATHRLVPSGFDGGEAAGAGSLEVTRVAVRWLTVIGFGMAAGTSAVIAFLPLYAQEEIGLSAPAAGLLAAAMGLSGVVARIAWGALGDRLARPSTGLVIISVIAIVSAVALVGAALTGPALLWLGAIGIGASALAWHALAWLVIIERVGTSGLGRASGIMNSGSGIGFAAGPPAAGLLIDVTGSYSLAWSSVAVLFALMTVLTVLLRWRTAGGDTEPEQVPGPGDTDRR